MNARKTKTPVELASDFVADSIDTAKAAFSADSGVAKESLDAINLSAKAYQARLADLQAKGMDIAESNTKAVLAFWRNAVAAKSPEALGVRRLFHARSTPKSKAPTNFRR